MKNDFINVALPKGRLGEKVYSLFEKAGYPCREAVENSRKLVFDNPDAGIRYFWVKPSDVAIYVERGAADIGAAGSGTLKVATKFSNIAREYYRGKGRDIDIIHLNGSIEIAPILGLSDVIVDIVETGTTLRENNLEVIDTILPISARLIANKSSYRFKNAEIRKLAEAVEKVVTQE